MEARCQVFTPESIAFYMLDLIGYNGNVYGKKVIENSCGEGNILCAIVSRYIEGLYGQTSEYIRNGLERDIVGYDVDAVCCEKTITKLNNVAQKYGIKNVVWNVSSKDTLSYNIDQEYDFVIGNPPYISYRHLEKEHRDFLRENYSSCKVGAFDYCYAFIEHGLKSLKTGGKLVYLIPSSIFKNVHAQNLRELMKQHLHVVCDYTTQKLFDKVLTSSALIVCEKDSSYPNITYKDMASKEEWIVSKLELIDKWTFTNNANLNRRNDEVRFGDLFSASIVVATLLNEAFVVSNFTEDANNLVCNGHLIEMEITRETASPRGFRNHRQERIIFPYYYENGVLCRYSEQVFSERFPLAVEYLSQYRDKLNKRDTDKNAKWFEYGRSQALRRINQKKLLVSTIVTENVEVYSLAADCIPYAGIYITPKKDVPLEVARRALMSADFKQYILEIGIYANGHSVRITPKDIEEYRFVL